MPFVVNDTAPAPKFTLAPTPGYVPTPAEQQSVDRINALVADTDLTPGTTPRAQEEALVRRGFVERLRSLANDFVADRINPESLYLTSLVDQGRRDERLDWVRDATIVVAPYSDEAQPNYFSDIQYDISRGVITKEQVDLKRAIDQAVTVVKAVTTSGPFPDLDKQHQYIRDLVNIGRIGLFNRNIELAKSNLDSLQQSFVTREASRIKNRYVNQLGLYSSIFIFLLVIIYLFLLYEADPEAGWRILLLPEAGRTPSHPFTLYRLRNFLLLGIGASFSAWLAFLIRAPNPEFSRLVQLDDDFLMPRTRVLFTIGLGFVVGLLFWTGLVSFTIGRFNTNFENSGGIAITIGVFCGVASRALAGMVARRSDEFAGNVGATAAAPRTT